MDRLPSELTHMVFGYLKHTEAANFRLLCRNVAELGLQYIVPTVYVRLQKKSYHRLSAIAEHPVVSKYVREICCEIDVLAHLSREEFEESTTFQAYKPPGFDDSARARRALNRTVRADSREKMDLAFSIYQEYLTDQEYMRHSDFFPVEVAKAMKQLPNLRILGLETGCTVERFEEDMGLILGAPFRVAWSDGYDEPCAGTLTILSMLLGAGNVGLNLETLHCSPVSWGLLHQNDEEFAIRKESMRYLRNLELQLLLPLLHEDTMMALDDEEEDEFNAYLENKRLVEFVTSAADLTDLSVEFYTCDAMLSVELKYIVGDFHWTQLGTVTFDTIKSTEAGLVGFCSKHSGTLKSVTLRDVHLIEEGNWPSVFQKMRRTLKLEVVQMSGLLGCDEGSFWNMDEYTIGAADNLRDRQRVSAYLLDHGGEDMSYIDFAAKMCWSE